MEKPKVKIAVLLNSLTIKAWSFEMLKRIEEGGHGEVVLLILNESKTKQSNYLARAWSYRRYWLYFIYRWIDQRRYRPSDSAFRTVDIRELLPDVPVLGVLPVEKRYTDYFGEEALEAIAAYQPDIMIRLGFRILRGGILKAARYGIWSYHHGDNTVNRGGPPAFWECFLGWDKTGSTLQVLTEDLDNGLVLYRSWTASIWYSPTPTNEVNYWKTVCYIPRMIRDLHKHGWEHIEENARRYNEPLFHYSERLFGNPHNLQLLGLLLRKAPRILSTAYQKAFRRNQWFLMYNTRPGIADSFRRYRYLLPPKDRFWADPFIIRRDGKYHIFFEDYVYKNHKAHISVIEMDEKGNMGEPRTVLERPYHLSYPHVFEHEGRTFMIPETRQNLTIELYECTHFPDQWELREVLMEDIHALDTTMLYDQGRWWMFACLREFGKSGNNDELFIFSSPELIGGQWVPHPGNPVVSDVERARPAGRIFRQGDHWIRPSQNCVRLYGYGFNLNRITELSPKVYKEETIEQVYPNWDKKIKGTHSFAREGSLTVIDALRTVPKH